MPQRDIFLHITTRKQAKLTGLKYYFNGLPCVNGHVSVKQTSNGTCRECVLSKSSAKSTSPRRDSIHNINNIEGFMSRSDAKKNKLTRYFTGKICSHGHISERMVSTGACVKCLRTHTESWLKSIPESKIESIRKRRAIRSKRYCIKNPIARSRTSAEYYKKNPLKAFVRKSIKRIEKAVGEDRLNKAELELGYTQKEFIKHIESLWLDGMSWENRDEWHIDHIKPLSLFIKEGMTDVKIINALSNLQPLWAKDNLSKGAKYEL